MDGRSFNDGYSERVKVEERSTKSEEEKPLIKRGRKPKEKVELRSKTVRLVLLKRKKVTIHKTISGNTYVFATAGSELDVDERDAPALLAKGAGGRSCCGTPTSPYFQIVE